MTTTYKNNHNVASKIRCKWLIKSKKKSCFFHLPNSIKFKSLSKNLINFKVKQYQMGVNQACRSILKCHLWSSLAWVLIELIGSILKHHLRCPSARELIELVGSILNHRLRSSLSWELIELFKTPLQSSLDRELIKLVSSIMKHYLVRSI